MRIGWMTYTVLMLSACGPGTLLIDDPVPSTDTAATPTVVLPGFPEDITFDFTPNPDQLTLEIFGGNSLYDYGFASTGDSPVYLAEDCHISGVCHPAGRTGVVLRVGTPVVPGSLTAYRELDPQQSRNNVTHVVRDRLQDFCWVWGHDPTHYADLGCILVEGSDEPVTPTVPPITEPPNRPRFQVVLIDGDQLPDTGSIDADRLRLNIDDGVGFYEFGYAQTGVGFNGWYGEDCLTGDTCHPAQANGISLTRVGSISEVRAGLTMLLPVDFPEADTPPLTYYAREVATDRCWVWGDDPSYYAMLGCEAGP